MTYATAPDVETEIGRPAISTAETAQWNGWLARVERSISRRFTREGYNLDEQVALNAPTAQDVIDVEVAAVARKIDNPRGVESSTTTRTVDDASVSNTERRKVGMKGNPLQLTDDEWDSLLPVKPKRSQVFSVMPS